MTEAKPASPVSERLDTWWMEYRFWVYLTGLIVLLCIGFLWNRMTISIPAGHHGVMYRRFGTGTVTDVVWGEGFYVIPPWDTLSIYETRLQERTIDFPTLTKDGLEIALTVSIRFYPLVGNLGYLHKDIGPEYFQRLIRPEVESNLRRIIGDHKADEIYSTEGNFLQEASRLTITVKNAMISYIRIDDVLLRKLNLPDVVRQAINEKHRQEQIVLSYDFRIQSEEKEAERKRIEASGIRDYNVIADEISPDLLRWRGVDATIALANSNNAKVVIIGGGQEGLPIILDTNTDTEGDAPASAGRPPTPTSIPPAPVPGAESAPPPTPAPPQ